MQRQVPRRGEIWFAFTPGLPDDPHQPRPALVVSENGRNFRRDHLIVVPVYSGGAAGPTRVPLPQGVGGIPHDSVLFCEELTTVHRGFVVDGPLGPAVPIPILQAVIWAVRRSLGDRVPEP